MWLAMDSEVSSAHLKKFNVVLIEWRLVSSDLVRYMSSTFKADGGTFLTKDPNWAADFAPDGASRKLD